MICIHTDFFATDTGFKQGLEMIGFCDFICSYSWWYMQWAEPLLAIALQERDYQFNVLF